MARRSVLVTSGHRPSKPSRHAALSAPPSRSIGESRARRDPVGAVFPSRRRLRLCVSKGPIRTFRSSLWRPDPGPSPVPRRIAGATRLGWRGAVRRAEQHYVLRRGLCSRLCRIECGRPRRRRGDGCREPPADRRDDRTRPRHAPVLIGQPWPAKGTSSPLRFRLTSPRPCL